MTTATEDPDQPVAGESADDPQIDPDITRADLLVEEAAALAAASAVEYSVRLVMTVTAGTPQAAANSFIERILRYGFDNFVYRVRELDSDEAWIVRGDEVITAEEFIAEMEARDGS